MLLLVGLGNPGPGHANNRHNIGFRALDAIIRRHSFSTPRRRFQGEACEGEVAGEKVVALKPLTYVNRSGDSVGAAMRFFKLAPAEVVVIHDELDLAAGRLRVKTGGGSAGHNGLKSITAHIGSDYRRVRVGIDHPGDKDAVTDYVLRDFAKADRAWIEPLLDAVADAFPLLVAGDDGAFMSRVALLTRPSQPPPEKPGRRPTGAGPPDDDGPGDDGL